MWKGKPGVGLSGCTITNSFLIGCPLVGFLNLDLVPLLSKSSSRTFQFKTELIGHRLSNRFWKTQQSDFRTHPRNVAKLCYFRSPPYDPPWAITQALGLAKLIESKIRIDSTLPYPNHHSFFFQTSSLTQLQRNLPQLKWKNVLRLACAIIAMKNIILATSSPTRFLLLLTQDTPSYPTDPPMHSELEEPFPFHLSTQSVSGHSRIISSPNDSHNQPIALTTNF